MRLLLRFLLMWMFRLLLLLKVLSRKKFLWLKSPLAVNEACEGRKTKRFVIYRSGILLAYRLWTMIKEILSLRIWQIHFIFWGLMRIKFATALPGISFLYGTVPTGRLKNTNSSLNDTINNYHFNIILQEYTNLVWSNNETRTWIWLIPGVMKRILFFLICKDYDSAPRVNLIRFLISMRAISTLVSKSFWSTIIYCQ